MAVASSQFIILVKRAWWWNRGVQWWRITWLLEKSILPIHMLVRDYPLLSSVSVSLKGQVDCLVSLQLHLLPAEAVPFAFWGPSWCFLALKPNHQTQHLAFWGSELLHQCDLQPHSHLHKRWSLATLLLCLWVVYIRFWMTFGQPCLWLPVW